MHDLIDRKAAIDILDAYQVMVENGEENPYTWARFRMSELPSAQPDSKETSYTHKALDTISRQAVIEINRSYHGQMPNEVNHRIWKEINELPSAQPEITRCKDCEHGAPNGRYGCRVYHYKRYETHDMKPDDFCSHAERRTDADTEV